MSKIVKHLSILAQQPIQRPHSTFPLPRQAATFFWSRKSEDLTRNTCRSLAVKQVAEALMYLLSASKCPSSLALMSNQQPTNNNRQSEQSTSEARRGRSGGKVVEDQNQSKKSLLPLNQFALFDCLSLFLSVFALTGKISTSVSNRNRRWFQFRSSEH